MSRIRARDPRLQELYEYWDGKRGTRIAPRRAEIQPDEIPKDMLPYVYIVEVIEGPSRRFRYRLVGTGIVREYGGDPTGKFLDEIDLDHVGHKVVSELDGVATTAQPADSFWHYTKNDGRELNYEHVILPLSDDGATVNMLLCGARIRGVG